MKNLTLTITVLGVLLSGFSVMCKPTERLIWNRTPSAPIGLYWRSDDPFTHGRWVIVSGQSGEARWAHARGFVGADWPLLKQIKGVPGDKICRSGAEVSVNNVVIARAMDTDSSGRKLPLWTGCHVLQSDEYFLLTSHPRSLDGRYFGVTKMEDLDGVAVPLFIVKDN